MKFILFINIEMPTIVIKPENSINLGYFDIHDKLNVMLSWIEHENVLYKLQGNSWESPIGSLQVISAHICE